MDVDRARSIPYWADRLGVVPNTVKGWVDNHGLEAEQHGPRKFVKPANLGRFLADNLHLPATGKALGRLEEPDTPDRNGQAAAAQEPAAVSNDAQDQGTRDRLRALQAQVATLDQRLAEAHDEIGRLKVNGDYWQERAGAHRRSLGELLDLEDRQDRQDRQDRKS